MLRRLLTILLYGILCSIVRTRTEEGYFNGSSYVLLNNTLSLQRRISLSFRTCSYGSILYQEGLNGDLLSLAVQLTGKLELKWKVDDNMQVTHIGTKLNDNHWHDVDLIYHLGSLSLHVDIESILIANSTFHKNLFQINLQSNIPNLYIGKNFSGCILQGPSIVLNSHHVQSFSVMWGECPLPDKADCTGYQNDSCFSQPCQNHGVCIPSSGDYICYCTLRYAGRNCQDDQGSLCNHTYNRCQNNGICKEDKTGNQTNCICPPKYTGIHCEIMVDREFCDSQPCRNGGSCTINEFANGYVCICPEGYTGSNCDLNIDECQPNPCQNGGLCTDEINVYTCDCTGTGYRGHNCEININECEENNPCSSSSTCFDRYGSYICLCPAGFEGKNCFHEINECLSSPCINGGTCMDYLDRYECRCPGGFSGINCEINIDDCLGIICPENSTCVDGINNYQCVCRPGYTGAFPSCFEIDECHSNPCQNGGTCMDRMNDFICSCKEGFSGKQCEMNANECISNPCQNEGSCIDKINNYSCECVPGYFGLRCENEHNECASNPCVANHFIKCDDLVNDYHCDCLPGWEGKNCDENTDECASQPCLHGSCIDHDFNYTCSCEPGYIGYNCNININDCEPNPCQNEATCEDLVNDFICNCTPTFMGRFCTDIYDACSFAPCQNEGICETVSPSHNYNCICKDGFTGKQCEINIDECEGVICPPGQVCFDLVNNYQCRCPEGFTGFDCTINIDECLNNPCVNGTCEDGINEYICNCPFGLTGKQCENDIDECNISTPCENGICQNTHGSYICYCRQGYTGEFCHIEFNECLSGPCKNNGTCWDLVSDYRCACVSGFTGKHCEIDINECASQPCLHGGICKDKINNYTCDCEPGYSGFNCEINIDECASSPCQNSGQCIDLINEYFCNCSDTGFEGMLCENNIDDCLSYPCQHESWCEDLVKDHHCHCYEGFHGKNCEIDFPDCSPNPCRNSALCLERSNRTLYETNYLGLFSSFSYKNASGYICICPSGFRGNNCEENIDDCEINECVNGTCMDGINNYSCNCLAGFTGIFCENEIDECKDTPCQNGSTCIDLIADYKCLCTPSYGGKNCTIELVGCINNKCENNASCIPYLSNEAHHEYKCKCPLGFYGDFCSSPTTVSFMSSTRYLNMSVYWEISVLMNNMTAFYNLSFQFRTTVSNGLLSASTTNHSSYVLYLNDGFVQLDLYFFYKFNLSLVTKNRYNDTKWRDVNLFFTNSDVLLDVSGEKIHDAIFEIEPKFFPTTVGGHRANTFSFHNVSLIHNFIGCIREVKINNRTMLPNIGNSDLFGDVVVGCSRTNQCYSNTCQSNGRCIDFWDQYFCECQQSFFGHNCEHSYSPATFGPNNTVGFAQLRIQESDTQSMLSSVDISLIIRTRKDNGLLFYLGSVISNTSYYTFSDPFTSKSYIQTFFKSGQFHVELKLEDSGPINVTIQERFNNGDYHLLQIIRHNDTLKVKTNNTLKKEVTLNNNILKAEQLYIGSYPPNHYLVKRDITYENNGLTDMMSKNNEYSIIHNSDVGNFKGLIKGMKINDKHVVFFPLEDVGVFDLPASLGNISFNEYVLKGEISDDPCIYKPCKNNATCMDVWNEYQCSCSSEFRGRNCSERQPCSIDKSVCPSPATCHNLEDGYECVVPAAFNGNASIYFQPSRTITLSSITFSYRTLDEGVLLDIFNHNFLISIINESFVLQWNSSTEIEKEVKFGNSVSDGDWHFISIKFQPKNILTCFDTVCQTSTDDLFYKADLSNTTTIMLGQFKNNNNFKGCIKEVRLNNLLLPFENSSDNFYIIQENQKNIGCVLCWEDECQHNTECRNSSESYECDCPNGYQGRYCQIDNCIPNPCENGGNCSHNSTKIYDCHCSVDYKGTNCEIMVNHCENNPCKNGGTCSDLKPGFKCMCPDDYEGKFCETKKVKDCSSHPCEHGGTCIDEDIDLKDITFTCVCPLNYTGARCENPKDFCEDNPCQNSGTCISDSANAKFICTCLPGYKGKTCNDMIDICSEIKPCNHGKCKTNWPLNYTCHCNYGYKGLNCTDVITSCHDMTTLCNHGTCKDVNNSYVCTCNEGYHGKHCVLIDKCFHENNCDEDKKCVPYGDEDSNYTGSRCECRDGELCNGFVEAESGVVSLAVIIGVPVACIFFLSALVGIIMFLRVAKKKRATRGTYSPSRQEMYGSRVEMNHVMKPPPEERLI